MAAARQEQKTWERISEDEGRKLAAESRWEIFYERKTGKLDVYYTDEVRFDNGFLRFKPKVWKIDGDWWVPRGVTEMVLSGNIRAVDPGKLMMEEYYEEERFGRVRRFISPPEIKSRRFLSRLRAFVVTTVVGDRFAQYSFSWRDFLPAVDRLLEEENRMRVARGLPRIEMTEDEKLNLVFRKLTGQPAFSMVMTFNAINDLMGLPLRPIRVVDWFPTDAEFSLTLKVPANVRIPSRDEVLRALERTIGSMSFRERWRLFRTGRPLAPPPPPAVTSCA